MFLASSLIKQPLFSRFNMKKLYRSFRRLGHSDRDKSTQDHRRSSFREQLQNDVAPPTVQTTSKTNSDGQTSSNAPPKPPEWEKDEELVRGSHCQFRVKYLGAKEVNDSRGMELCDDAFSSLLYKYKQLKKSGPLAAVNNKLLRSKNSSAHVVSSGSQRPAQNAIFYISSDGLRVVDENSKSLIVDQTIEKVSFCAPVRLNPKGFAYIARDGATKRWMCHVLLAKDVKVHGLHT